MTAFDTVLGALRQAQLNEIYVPGFIDVGESGPVRGAVCRFRPQRHAVYLALDGHLVECGERESAAGMFLQVRLVDEIDMHFPIDPDDQYAYAPVMWSVLEVERASPRINELEVFADDVCRIEDGMARAVGLSLELDEYLFFDPLTWEGIHIGGRLARERWASEFSARYPSHTYSFR